MIKNQNNILYNSYNLLILWYFITVHFTEVIKNLHTNQSSTICKLNESI